MKEVTATELKEMKDSGKAYQLIDVREEYEYEIANLGGELIPMAELTQNVDRIDKSMPVIIHCRSGARSASIIGHLEKTYGFTNLYNLKGGILAYGKDIDPSLTSY